VKHLSPRSYPWIVLAVAVAIRVWTLLDALRAPFWKVPLVDELAYLQTAARILQHQPPPLGAYYTAPGYAWILGAVLALGLDPQIVKFTQLLVGIASAWMVYRLTARWFSPREGLVAGLLWALYPSALFHELLLLKPTFTVALVVGALLLMSSVPRDGLGGKERWSRTVGAGLLLGLATLLRGETLLVGLILAGVLARTLRRRRLAWTVALGLLAGQAAVVAVPTALNLARGAGPVVVAYSGGVNFYIGNHPGADGGYLPLIPDRSDARVEERDAVELARRRMGRPLDAAAVSRFWSEEGLRFWREHPGDAVALTVRKLALLWSPQEIADVLSRRLASRWVRSLRNPVIGGGLVLPLALVGLVLSWRRRQAWLARGYLLASEAALVPFFLFERFRLPMIAGAVVPLAAHAVVRAWDAARSRQWKGLVTAVLATAVVGAALSIVHLDREDVVLRVNVGSMLLEAGRYEEALEEFEAVRRQEPSAWRVEMNIAATLAAMGCDGEAVQTLRSVLEKLYAEGRATGHPVVAEIVQCHELAGDLLVRMRHLEDARRQYDAALRWKPGDERLLRKRRSIDPGSMGEAGQGGPDRIGSRVDEIRRREDGIDQQEERPEGRTAREEGRGPEASSHGDEHGPTG